MNTEIKLVQVPVISHLLKEVGQNVTDRLDSLNLENQVATVDTVKSLKELRADLNKELADFEGQRKFIKDGILSPYNDFEALYKTEVSDKYEGAIEKLKNKIDVVENKIKDEKRANVKFYFDELCVAEKVDFLTFDMIALEINLSTSEKKYKDKCNDFVLKVADEVALIKTNEFEAEIMVEYKSTLNAAKAIKTIQDRKENERLEAERIRIAELNRRKEALKRLGMTFMDMTNAYEYDAEIYMTVKDIDSLSKDDFNVKAIELHEAIKAKKAQAEKAAQAEISISPDHAPVKRGFPLAPPAAPLSAPVAAPVENKTEEIVSASFEVTGTMTQLRALGQYMKSNNITYKNI